MVSENDGKGRVERALRARIPEVQRARTMRLARALPFLATLSEIQATALPKGFQAGKEGWLLNRVAGKWNNGFLRDADGISELWVVQAGLDGLLVNYRQLGDEIAYFTLVGDGALTARDGELARAGVDPLPSLHPAVLYNSETMPGIIGGYIDQRRDYQLTANALGELGRREPGISVPLSIFCRIQGYDGYDCAA